MSDPTYLRIKVKPKANKNEITETLDDGTIKITIKAAPEKGKANKALIKFLAKKYKVKKSQVKIVSGQTSQIKLIRIDEPTN